MQSAVAEKSRLFGVWVDITLNNDETSSSDPETVGGRDALAGALETKLLSLLLLLLLLLLL